jgi:ethanolamine-phosphate cytidylyltransferase
MAENVLLNPHEKDDAYPLYGLGPVPPKKAGTVRIWVDGCFDMLHFGHTNALRQARALGTELFVGCHSDEEVQRVKGPPTMTAKERYDALRACKWVDYVVENYPYSTRLKDMDLLEIDYVAHGDDISMDANGQNSYQEIINAGKFKVFKRTDGISTTDLVSRMLLCTSDHQIRGVPLDGSASQEDETRAQKRYLTTNRKILQFSNSKSPKDSDRIVYVDGSFDLFHVGHMRLLEEARKHGTYLIAGVHEDSVVNKVKGKNYPIMNLNERVLGVLSCRYVDEVVMGVPFSVTEEVVKSLHIDVVVGGKRNEPHDHGDPWAVPKALGVFVEVESHSDLTTEGVIRRVLEHRDAFLARQEKKAVKDAQMEGDKPEEYRNVREVA